MKTKMKQPRRLISENSETKSDDKTKTIQSLDSTQKMSMLVDVTQKEFELLMQIILQPLLQEISSQKQQLEKWTESLTDKYNTLEIKTRLYQLEQVAKFACNPEVNREELLRAGAFISDFNNYATLYGFYFKKNYLKSTYRLSVEN